DVGLAEELPASDRINILKAEQKSLDFNATQTIYEFACGDVDLKLTFTSPLLMDNLDLMSRPVTYITTQVKSNDNNEHRVDLYFGASTNIAVHRPYQEVKASEYSSRGLQILRAGTVEQPVLQRTGDDVRIDWGYMYVAVPANSKTI